MRIVLSAEWPLADEGWINRRPLRGVRDEGLGPATSVTWTGPLAEGEKDEVVVEEGDEEVEEDEEEDEEDEEEEEEEGVLMMDMARAEVDLDAGVASIGEVEEVLGETVGLAWDREVLDVPVSSPVTAVTAVATGAAVCVTCT